MDKNIDFKSFKEDMNNLYEILEKKFNLNKISLDNKINQNVFGYKNNLEYEFIYRQYGEKLYNIFYEDIKLYETWIKERNNDQWK
jgi:hypothetical protein